MSESEMLDVQGIDALLDRFRSRKRVQEKLQPKLADFEVDAPNALRARALASMELRFRNIADQAGSDISSALRAHVRFELKSLRQLRLRSIIEPLPDRLCIVRLACPELKPPGFILLESETTTSIIDRLVGGSGATSALDRDLTAIERRVLSDVLRPFLAVHQAGLTPVMPLHLEIGNFLGCSAELTAWPATDLYLIADYTAKVEGKIDWGFRFAFPLGSTIDAIERSAVEAPALSLDDQDRKRSLQAALRDVPVSSTIDIGRSELTLTDVTTLAPGDVVLLDRKKDAWLDFRIEGVIKYRGTLGRTGKSLAFKVAQVVETRSVAKKKA